MPKLNLPAGHKLYRYEPRYEYMMRGPHAMDAILRHVSGDDPHWALAAVYDVQGDTWYAENNLPFLPEKLVHCVAAVTLDEIWSQGVEATVRRRIKTAIEGDRDD